MCKDVQYEIMYSHEITTYAYFSNLPHKCVTGKVICGRLDAITLSIVALLISSLLSDVTEQQPSYCMPQAVVITNSKDPVLQLCTSYIL
jgi:hypothetical protein